MCEERGREARKQGGKEARERERPEEGRISNLKFQISNEEKGKSARLTTARRTLMTVLGIGLLVVTFTEAYFQSFGFYKEHYIWPKEKFGVLSALRWQDVVFLGVFWPLAGALCFVSYRLLRSAFKR